MRVRPGLALLLVSLLLSSTRAAAMTADEQPDAGADEAALARGVELRRQRRDDEALAQFQAAYRARATGRARAQIGLAEQALGRWLDAERDLEGALASRSESWIAANREALAQALEEVRRRNGTLRVACDRAGAEVFVGGAAIGRTPLAPFRVAAGRAEIEIRVPRLPPARQIVNVAAGSEHTLSFTFAPAVPVGLAAPSARTMPSATLAVPAAGPDVSPRAARRRAWGWALSGLGALAIGEGIGAHLLAVHLASQYNDDHRCLVGGLTREQSCGGLREGASAAQAAAIVGYGVGAAALGSGLYLLVTSRGDGSRAVVNVAASDDRLVVGVQGRF